MSDEKSLRDRLRVLESDLKDSEDSKVLDRWPNLGSQELKQQVRRQIDAIKSQLAGDCAEQPCDRIVEAVRADLLRRSQLGIQKYGTTLERDDLTLKQWLQHAYEECLDQALYLKRAIIELGKQEGERA